jgi:hypothetical protein
METEMLMGGNIKLGFIVIGWTGFIWLKMETVGGLL